MLQRMNELAVQAANGTNSASDRTSIQNEIDQLTTEIDRVAETTKFNETYLLKGATGYRDKYMAAHDAGLEGTLADGLDAGKAATFTTEIKTDTDKTIAGKSYHIYDKSTDTISVIQGKISLSSTGLVDESKKVTSSITINGTTYVAAKSYAADANAVQKKMDELSAAAKKANANATTATYTGHDKDGADKTITFSINAKVEDLSSEDLDHFLRGTDFASAANKKADKVADDIFKYGDEEFTVEQMKAKVVDGAKVAVSNYNGQSGDDRKAETVVNNRTAVDVHLDKNIQVSTAIDKAATALVQANKIGVDAGNQKNVQIKTATGTNKTDKTEGGNTVTKNGDNYTFSIQKSFAKVSKDLGLQLHVGADADMTNKITIGVEAMTSKNLGVQNLNVVDSTGVAATYAIDAIEDAIKTVSSQRSALGAVQNRLEHTIKNLDNVVENTTAAESRIRDTDMANEMVTYSKNNILAQAGQSMLAQANQSKQGVLSLLG
jgi:flagellin